jgi:hypothetical protein
VRVDRELQDRAYRNQEDGGADGQDDSFRGVLESLRPTVIPAAKGN